MARRLLDHAAVSEQVAQNQSGAAYRIARNALSILLGDAAGEVLTGYAIVLAVVSLGPSGFGTLSEAQAFMEPFDALAALGLGNVAITVAAARGKFDGVLRGTIWGIRCVSAILAATIGISIAFVSGRGNLWPLLLVIGVGMLATPASVAANLPYQYNQAVHRRIAIPFVVGLVRVGTAYAALKLMNRPIGYQLSGLCAGVAAAGINNWWVKRHFPDAPRFDWSLAKRLLVLGWPAAVLEFVVAFYMRASYIFLHEAGHAVQGQYAAADRLLRPVLAISAAVFVSSLPTVAQLAAQREYGKLLTTYKRSVARVTIGLAPVVAASWFLAAWLLKRFAPEYTDAVTPFRIMIAGTFFLFLNQLSTTYIMALGKFRLIMCVALVNLAVYVVLASWLVPKYGATGAALATSLMEGVNTTMQLTIVGVLLKRVAGQGVVQ